MVVGGYWITYLNIQNLSQSLMSLLSNMLTQVHDRKDTISINNEQFSTVIKTSQTFAFFSTAEDFNNIFLTDSNIDSLKITKIDHFFSLISKDLLDKFRVIKFDYNNLRNYIDYNLISNGISNNESICSELMKLYYVYKNVLNVKTKFNSNNI